MATATTISAAIEQQCWQAVTERDAHYDGTFVFAVRTTGVYCRPSCPARRPKPENVEFFAAPHAAEDAGFRACRRCHPQHAAPPEPNAALIAQVCRYLQAHADAPPTLDALGAQFNISPFHLQRTFKRVVGMTPRQYSAAQRIDRFKTQLKASSSVTTAVYDAGYGSSSRAYEQATERLGMTPATYRRGGANMQIQYTIADSALGKVLVAATDRGVCAVYLGDDEAQLTADLRAEYPAATIERDGEQLHAWVMEIVQYANGMEYAINLPLDVRATAWQQRVWDALRAIPAGTTRTYGEIAAQLGQPGAARAVGRACATNRVALVIPCHRAVASDGKMHGYRWGVARKQQLLAQERVVVVE